MNTPWGNFYIPFDFEEDFELQPVSLEEIQREKILEMEKEEPPADFQLPPEWPLSFDEK